MKIKTEPVEPPDSPDSSQPADTTSKQTWIVPIKEEVHPGTFLEVVVEEEDPDAEDEKPATNGIASDEDYSPEKQASSDSDEGCETFPTTSSGGFLCEICRKIFVNSGNLKRHMQLHTKETIKCPQCPGQFLNQIRLDRHIFHRHTKDYPCNECPKKFKTSSNLNQHKKTHLKNKPYKCTKCPASFSFKSNLQKHQRGSETTE
ncbi:hypothetical protein PYW07_011279 [Mythimna separata]|uniref:C2H2-type domain-containing protein n=1 Tax=Mythimna separata TaxID=271217 RepID=A0AAD7Y924_MYTSE|nr:hypothetical protein PYW07_011279 [Mythimna separata]